MKKIIRKLKSKAGESLVESMAAILIFTLSSIALLSMISASADINRTAKVADQQFQKQMTVVEKAESTDAETGTRAETGYVTFMINKDPNNPVSIAEDKVYICQKQYNDSEEQDNNSALYAYYLDRSEGAQK